MSATIWLFTDPADKAAVFVSSNFRKHIWLFSITSVHFIHLLAANIVCLLFGAEEETYSGLQVCCYKYKFLFKLENSLWSKTL